MAISSTIMTQLYLNGYEIFEEIDQSGTFAFYNRQSGEGSEFSYDSHEKAANEAFANMRKKHIRSHPPVVDSVWSADADYARSTK